jgi:hypothetical protein
MPTTLTDHGLRLGRRWTAASILLLLGASLLCVAVAPLAMPDSYAIVEHSISESAAQGVESAWLTRTGFLLLGFAVLISAGFAGPRWGVGGRIMHRMYGVAMIAVAAYAHSPWEDVPFDEFEDLLHSVAAGGVGLAFTVGVLTVMVQRGPHTTGARMLDLTAAAAATILPIIMFNAEGIGGVVQRVLFLVGYAWYAIEAVRSARATTPSYGREEATVPQVLAAAVPR